MSERPSTVWREPAEHDTDIYPGLSVWDDRVSGSITFNDSRLPLWAIIWSAINRGWGDVEKRWSPTEHYGYQAADLAEFLSDLLEARGEFGRLLCVVADVRRIERERGDEWYESSHCRVCSDEPGPWWGQGDLRQRVVDQLRRCLDVLGES